MRFAPAAAWAALAGLAPRSAAPRQRAIILVPPEPADSRELPSRLGPCTSRRLFEWVRRGGGEVHRHLELRQAVGWRRRGRALVPHDDGVGLFAAAAIASGEGLFSIPRDLVLWPLRLHGSVSPSPAVAAAAPLAASLARERHLGSRSRWAPYVDCLPARCDLPLCANDGGAGLNSTADPAMVARVAALREQFLAARLQINWAAAGVGAAPAEGDWLWAVGMVMSRGVEAGSADQLSLVPLWDAANHRAGGPLRGRPLPAAAGWRAHAATRVARDEELRRDYCRDFGQAQRHSVPNSIMLQRYGFSSPNEANDFSRTAAPDGSPLLIDRRLLPAALARFRRAVAARYPQVDAAAAELERPAAREAELAALDLCEKEVRGLMLPPKQWPRADAATPLGAAALDYRELLAGTVLGALSGLALRRGLGRKWLRRSCTDTHWVEAMSWPVHGAQRALLPRYSEHGYLATALPPDLATRLRALWLQHRHRAVPEAEARGAARGTRWGSDFVEGYVIVGDAAAGDTAAPLTHILPLEREAPALAAELSEQVRLRAEGWLPSAGSPLRRTSLYGMREYRRGSVLIPHVDNYNTHVISAIVHVSQEGLTEPWPLAVWAAGASRCAEIDMGPGADLVLYESATALHGRPAPLRGDSFVNIFLHFAPPDWEASVSSWRRKAALIDLHH